MSMKVSRSACWFILTLVLAVSAGASTIEQILKYRNLSAVKVSPDGSRAVFVAAAADVEENAMNSDVWCSTSPRPQPPAHRAPKRDNAPSGRPTAKRIAFLSDRGKESKVNIWMISPEGGEAEAATKFDKLSVSSFRWMPTAPASSSSPPIRRPATKRSARRTRKTSSWWRKTTSTTGSTPSSSAIKNPRS
jgi:dipeptidyl aminopeptidase/acylaminoacyl peptidase